MNVLSKIMHCIWRSGSSWASNKSGVATIEFAFIALPFFAILIAVIQIGIVFLAANELQTAVEKAGRQLLTGAAQQANMTQAQFTNAVCANLPVLFTCSGVMVDLQTVSAFSSAVISPPVLTYNSQGQVSNNWAFNSGGAGSILVLRIIYQFPVVLGPLGFNLVNLPNGKHLMMATSVFQVEPYTSTGS